MTTVRTDVLKLGDKFATLLGDEVQVGQAAPEFTSAGDGWASVNPIQESKGKVIIFWIWMRTRSAMIELAKLLKSTLPVVTN